MSHPVSNIITRNWNVPGVGWSCQWRTTVPRLSDQKRIMFSVQPLDTIYYYSYSATMKLQRKLADLSLRLRFKDYVLMHVNTPLGLQNLWIDVRILYFIYLLINSQWKFENDIERLIGVNNKIWDIVVLTSRPRYYPIRINN